MERPFLTIYDYFQRSKGVFWAVLMGSILLLGIGATQVRLEEDITRFFPNDDRVEKLTYIFKNSRFSDRLFVMVSVRDSSYAPVPDTLVRIADQLCDSISTKLSTHISEIRGKIDDSGVVSLFKGIQDHLPVYLTDDDYARIDSLSDQVEVAKVLEQNIRQLIAPGGIVMKKVIVRDPLGFSLPVMGRLRNLQVDDNFEIYDNYIVTKDRRHLLVFVQPKYSSTETKNNAVLQRELDKVISSVASTNPEILVSYFGGSVVAVGNATQLQRDTILTVSIMIVLLLVVLLSFFRKKRVPFLILLPVVFGALFSLSVIAVTKSSLSVLALAVGAVILGVAVDYSIHFLVQLREIRDTRQVIKHVAKPLTIGNFTTVLAFLCLQFTNAAVLQDVGLFAALALIGAALSCLIFLPHLIDPAGVPEQKTDLIRRISVSAFDNKRMVVYAIFLLTPVFLYFAGEVRFNSDMNKLNFMTQSIREANQRLESITKSSLSSVYVVSSGTRMEDALRRAERTSPVLENLRHQGSLTRIDGVSNFVFSDSLQNARIKKWNSFWTPDRIEKIRNLMAEEAPKVGFSNIVISNLDSLLLRKYERVPSDTTNIFRRSFFRDLMIEEDGRATVVTTINGDIGKRSSVYEELKKTASTPLDRGMLTNLFVDYVHSDFNYIVNVTSILVFLALLISYGRIELTLITFIPMLITWIWILGIMALLQIEFNIVNVMVSTFIFGLGDDYSIFITDGLQNQYRSGKNSIAGVRTSVFLSAITTVAGLGVLVFARHPALKSVAAISIIGILCVFVMSQLVQPFLFRALISGRTERGLPPITALGAFKTFYTYAWFVVGSFLLTIVGLILRAVPFKRENFRHAFHWLISRFTWFNLASAYQLSINIRNRHKETFAEPSVIIANHSSFLDILITTSLHPKLILLTNKWVYNSPVFGGVVRLADYYPVMEGAEGSVPQLRERVAEGYSIVVFPEGTRSPDGVIKRFHKGAFFMAEQLNLPILPLLIHGAGDGIRKGDMYLNNSRVTVVFLSKIFPGDDSFGATYAERTKMIGRFFRAKHEKLRQEIESPGYFHHKLITNYLYKGPVLEWYMRIKLRLEKDYEAFHKLVPLNASVLDLGCGYGFLDYMLQFLSNGRVITGVDYDEEKIETAQNGYLRSERLNFICSDVTQFPLTQYDVIIIADVLHYLASDEQDRLITRCFGALNPGGRLIIRDGNKDLEQRHKGTKATEFFSVKLLGFNKSRNDLNFISGSELTEKAHRHGLTVEVQDDSRFTSNVIFVISKPEGIHAEV